MDCNLEQCSYEGAVINPPETTLEVNADGKYNVAAYNYVSVSTGGGGGGGTDIYIVEFGDLSGSTVTANKTRGEIMQAFNENKIVLGFETRDSDGLPVSKQYSFLSFYTGVLSVEFNNFLLVNMFTEPDSSTSWTKQS